MFVSPLLVALVTWVWRRSLAESLRWAMTHGRADEVGEAARQLGLEGETAPVTREKSEWRRLFAPGALRRFAFITPIYVLWGIPAGPSAFFLPCIFKTTGATTAAGGDLMEMLWSFSAIVAVIVISMPFNDRVDRRLLDAVSTAFCATAFYPLAVFPITNPAVAILNVLLFGFGQGIGLWPLQRVQSVELFVTDTRSTAQGMPCG